MIFDVSHSFNFFQANNFLGQLLLNGNSGWEVFKIYQNTERLVIIIRLKNALYTVDHVV